MRESGVGSDAGHAVPSLQMVWELSSSWVAEKGAKSLRNSGYGAAEGEAGRGPPDWVEEPDDQVKESP